MQGGFDVNGAKLGPVLPPLYAIRVFLSEICEACGCFSFTTHSPVLISSCLQGLRALRTMLGLKVLRIS
jgi:hypothetical protein